MSDERRQAVLYEVTDEGVGVVTLNRPDKANSQTPAMLDELNDVLMGAAADRAVKVIVLQANGKHFSAGHDISGEGRREEDAIDLKVEGLAGIYEWETKRYIGYSPCVARHPQADDRRGAGSVHRRRPAAVLADGHHHRRRQRQVLRPGRADGHRRRRVPRPHVGARPAQGQGMAVHRQPVHRCRGREVRHGQPRGAARRAARVHDGAWPAGSPG